MSKNREQAERYPDYRSFFDHIPIGFYQTSVDGRILDANNYLVRLLGYPDRETLLAVKATDIYLEPYTRQQVQEDIEKLEVLQGYELQLRRRDGSTIWVEDYTRAVRAENGDLLYYVGSLIDIREKKLLAESRIKSEKLKMQGLLIDGISHDFSNLLTIILGNISLLKNLIDQDSGGLKPLEKIETASQKMNDLVYKFFKMSKSDVPSTGTVSVQTLVPEILAPLKKLPGIGWKVDLPGNLWPIFINRDRAESIFKNVIDNAVDAIQGSGEIEIHAENITRPEEADIFLQGDGFVKAVIRDNGSGIPVEILPKIFDPYFSTKERVTDKGSGLGLTITQVYVKKSGGDIRVESSLGRGTTVTIWLPGFKIGR